MGVKTTVTEETIGDSLRSMNRIKLKIRHRLQEACKLASALKVTVGLLGSDFDTYLMRDHRSHGSFGNTIILARLK